ncbi:MAG TPA: replication-associated recombination protein A [Mesotoga sp.]|nr:replication-associated recombination protein A [Mesotoga sp.]NLX33480.1 replication-associated recombination protein A [Thermotogaceae bacterium]MDD4039423.1 replication-associated recombination protein A [Mesotoga sp.]MDD5743318.1 replication-associated recombination protein A [Mesotoga sp.]HOI63090.1 replication-associated recombination protein A [Mesotoga sp.]
MSISETNWKPLSERIRPRTFDDLVGQEHLAGKKGIIRGAVESGRLFSMILYGPPGTGKTTIGELIRAYLGNNYHFEFFSASLQGTADLKKHFSHGERLKAVGQQLVLFVDEIHRLNKSQQDVFLPVTERGTIVLIGATTENPSFEVNPALLSRCRLVILKQLNAADILRLLSRALERDTFLSTSGVSVDNEVLEVISGSSGGDARIALNLLDTLVESAAALEREKLDLELMNELSVLPSGRYTKKGEEHYDIASAFIKSMRGSDPDAALYYMIRMLEGGEDPKFIARRMVIFSSEDIGLSDPMALVIAISAFEAVNSVGLPECILNLSEAAIYLSVATKSNRVNEAMMTTRDRVRNTPNLPVPLKLRNAVTNMMKGLGYGKDYHYPHDSGGFSKEYYLPEEIKQEIYYKPGNIGKERQVAERLRTLWKGLKEYPEE